MRSCWPASVFCSLGTRFSSRASINSCMMAAAVAKRTLIRRSDIPLAGGEADRGGDVGLAGAARSQGDDVVVAGNELSPGAIEHALLVEAGDGLEIEALQTLDRRELGGLDPVIDHPGFAVEELEFDQPGQMAHMVDVIAGALSRQLLMLARNGGQLQPLEMMLEQQLGRFGGGDHDDGQMISAL